MGELMLRSPAFEDGEKIPRKYGYKEDDVNPPLKISRIPAGAESLALVMDDPDAKEPAGKIWDHWVVWDIEPNTSEIPENSIPPGAMEGKNDYDKRGYGGPNPPDREHTYRFKLYALDTTLDLPPGSTKEDVRNSMKGHILDKAMLTGTYAP